MTHKPIDINTGRKVAALEVLVTFVYDRVARIIEAENKAQLGIPEEVLSARQVLNDIKIEETRDK